jgi:spore coat protein U-like protein
VRIRAIILALLLAPTPAFALLCGTVLDPMSVSATALSFGSYTPASASPASTTVTIACGLLGLDLLPDFTVALSAGNATTPSGRYLVMSGNHLGYNIYTSTGYATVWGDGSGGSVTQSFNSVLSLGTINYTGYGRIPAGQNVAAGPYTDNITVTVTY